jgi:two-component system, OmpR family, response regulator
MRSDASVSVLIVEDSILVRQRLKALLLDSGAVGHVAEADSEADAVAHLTHFTPDVAIVDLRLRAGTGLGFLRSLKLRAPRCLAIVLSTLVLPEIHDLCLRAGADHVLRKSSEFERAIDLVAQVATKPIVCPGKNPSHG